jgi:hypothetical protein
MAAGTTPPRIIIRVGTFIDYTMQYHFYTVQETRLCLEDGTEALFALLSPQWKLLYAAIDTTQGSPETYRRMDATVLNVGKGIPRLSSGVSASPLPYLGLLPCLT